MPSYRLAIEFLAFGIVGLTAAQHPSAVHVGAENQLHAMEFLEYAYLQIGEDEKAREIMRDQSEIRYEQVDKNLIDYVNRTRANSPAMYYLETRDWKGAEALKPDPKAETYNQAIIFAPLACFTTRIVVRSSHPSLR